MNDPTPAALLRAASDSRRGPSSRPLSDHQLDALRRSAAGETHGQIAAALGIDIKSVGTIFKEVFRKLGAVSTPNAVLLACQAGLLDGRPQRHGDHAGYTAHLRRGEDPCKRCRAGERVYRNGRQAVKEAA